MNPKEEAARAALRFVRSGMALGLGTGSTAGIFAELLARELQAGTLSDIVAVPTSEATAMRARALGIPTSTLAEHFHLDLVVDGADEVDPHLDLIKGLGRALLREKVVAAHAERLVIAVDESKLVDRLGRHVPLPVEVLPFGLEAHMRWLATLGCRVEPRREVDGALAVTDNGNYLADCTFRDGIGDPYALARALADRPGILEHGLFLGLASAVVVAGQASIRLLERTLSGHRTLQI